MPPKTGYVYILSNKTRFCALYRSTSELLKRIQDHRNGIGSYFTRKYKTKYLVYYEEYDQIYTAIKREKQLKNWNRQWKLDLIREINPKLRDLWGDIITNSRDR